MYIKKITFKAFKDYLKNPTDFFLEGNIFISDDIAKYCRLVRTPAAKGEHNVEILYGGVQFTYHPECNMGGKEFSSNSSLNFMGYVVDGETIYSASKALHELFPKFKTDTTDEQILIAASEELEAYLDTTVCIEPHELLDPRYQRRAYKPAVKKYALGNSACGTIFDNFPNLLQHFDDIDKVDFLANPTGWGERYATMKESLLFDKEIVKFMLCVQHCVKQYIKEFEEHTDCYESQCETLMDALDGCNIVRIAIKVNGQTYRVDYPAAWMQDYETISTKGLPIRGVRGSKAKIDRFLAENYKDYDHETIPLKLISHIRNNSDRMGTIWTNPFFEEV